MVNITTQHCHWLCLNWVHPCLTQQHLKHSHLTHSNLTHPHLTHPYFIHPVLTYPHLIHQHLIHPSTWWHTQLMKTDRCCYIQLILDIRHMLSYITNERQLFSYTTDKIWQMLTYTTDEIRHMSKTTDEIRPEFHIHNQRNQLLAYTTDEIRHTKLMKLDIHNW